MRVHLGSFSECTLNAKRKCTLDGWSGSRCVPDFTSSPEVPATKYEATAYPSVKRQRMATPLPRLAELAGESLPPELDGPPEAPD